MPKKIERKLKLLAQERGYGKKRTARFVHGTLRHEFGWKPKKQKPERRLKKI